MNVMSKSSLNLGPNCSPGTREEAPAPLTVLRVVSLTRNSLKWLPRSLGGHQALLSTIPVQGGELGPCPGCGTDPCCAQPQGLRRRAAEPPERPRRVPRAARVPALPHHLPGPPPLQHLQVSPPTSAMGGCGTTDPAPSTGMGIPAPEVLWEQDMGLGHPAEPSLALQDHLQGCLQAEVQAAARAHGLVLSWLEQSKRPQTRL